MLLNLPIITIIVFNVWAFPVASNNMDFEEKCRRAATEASGYLELIKMGKELGVDTSKLREQAIATLSEALKHDNIEDMDDPKRETEFIARLQAMHAQLISEVRNHDGPNSQQQRPYPGQHDDT